MQKSNSITRRSFVATTVSAAVVSALPEQAEASATTSHTREAQRISLTPYLLFNGNCREAMEFYKQCLGGELELTKVKDSGAKDHLPAFQQEKVLNAKLRSGVLEIAASDWLRPQETPMRGNTVCM